MAGRGDPEQRRRRMVRRDIAARGVTDPSVLDAMADVPRERFVPEDLERSAYDDRALPIASGQTISQPYIVALMAEAAEVRPGDRVLEVGTGSGYGAAILGRLGAEVWTIERHAPLAGTAAVVLSQMGFDRVHVIEGDGTLGHPEAAPYDAIVVTAAGPVVPPPLLEQLAEGGRLVMPVGLIEEGQDLIRFRRTGERFGREDLGPVRFVPLVAGRPDTSGTAPPTGDRSEGSAAVDPSDS